MKKGIWGDDFDGDECIEKIYVFKKRCCGYWNKVIVEILR